MKKRASVMIQFVPCLRQFSVWTPARANAPPLKQRFLKTDASWFRSEGLRSKVASDLDVLDFALEFADLCHSAQRKRYDRTVCRFNGRWIPRLDGLMLRFEALL